MVWPKPLFPLNTSDCVIFEIDRSRLIGDYVSFAPELDILRYPNNAVRVVPGQIRADEEPTDILLLPRHRYQSQQRFFWKTLPVP